MKGIEIFPGFLVGILRPQAEACRLRCRPICSPMARARTVATLSLTDRPRGLHVPQGGTLLLCSGDTCSCGTGRLERAMIFACEGGRGRTHSMGAGVGGVARRVGSRCGIQKGCSSNTSRNMLHTSSCAVFIRAACWKLHTGKEVAVSRGLIITLWCLSTNRRAKGPFESRPVCSCPILTRAVGVFSSKLLQTGSLRATYYFSSEGLAENISMAVEMVGFELKA